MKLIKLLNVEVYDEYHSYGTDWVNEYTLESDKELTSEKAVNWLFENHHSPYGNIFFKKIEENKYILKSIMY